MTPCPPLSQVAEKEADLARLQEEQKAKMAGGGTVLGSDATGSPRGKDVEAIHV